MIGFSRNSVATEGSKTVGGSGAPAIVLPKGGGAIRGIGEKFAANPVTGTGSTTIPIATTPGRGGFGPALSLSYDSGSGNGSFGLGWSLSIPAITRKTDKGIPQYRDEDVFILSGAEDLVPALKTDASGKWMRDTNENLIIDDIVRDGFTVRRYRPRVEGLFARIEQWTREHDDEVHWRSISKDNITTVYGRTPQSRIADPANPTHVFSWLICESYDDRGNAIHYEYKSEDGQGIDLLLAHESNRSEKSRSINRHLKRIKYGNHTPRKTDEELSLRNDWLFEVVFDYGEHYTENVQGQLTSVVLDDKQRIWSSRKDPFSTYRAGFEVRNYRLCQHVLMFHHFPRELGTADCLVRSTEFSYAQSPIASFITSVIQSSFRRRNDGTYQKKSLPSLDFTYSSAIIQEEVQEADGKSLENLPYGLDGSHYQWVDLDGEGASGIFTEQGEGWFYKRNLSPGPAAAPSASNGGRARFGPLESLARKPSMGA